MPTAPQLPPITPPPPPATRPSTTARGYGAAHQRKRALLIQLHPLCQRCGNDWSRHLHHIDHNPHNRADGNCVMLCERCHQIEHAGK